jgi:hypothetical protein
VINTFYIERLNVTFREWLASLTRRDRTLERHTCTLLLAMYLIGTVYNFCTPHEGMWRARTAAGKVSIKRTPAMAARVAAHC